MAHIILFDDDETRNRLLPLTYTRPVADLRIGILTIKEKWERWMAAKASYITQDYLAGKFSIDYDKENFVVNGSVLPSKQLCKLLQQMDFGEAYLAGEELIAAKMDGEQFEKLIHDEDIGDLRGIDLQDTEYIKINHTWDLFLQNGVAIQQDFDLLTRGRRSQPISGTNVVIGADNIFVEEGAYMEGATLNANTGPIYVGKDATIMEGSMVRGALALCEGAVIKMGAKIYGSTTIGPVSKVGGEVSSTIIQGYTNKAHDGYLGNSVIGEWCNLGADSNTSNLKNNYGVVKMWNYPDRDFVSSGQQFCGLIMGDHSKAGINIMFNTGTVVGVCSNVFGSGFPPNFVPSFSWGGGDGFKDYQLDKAFETIERVCARRNKEFDVQDRLIMIRIFEDSSNYREA